MNKTTVLMAFVYSTATVTVLSVGLAALPGSVQEAQANPCYTSAPVDLEVEADFSCDFEGIGSLDIEEELATLSVCKEIMGGSSQGFEPNDFTFTVTGNNPSPNQFEGNANCVDVTIGPGEFTVSEVVPPLGGVTLDIRIEGDCEQDPIFGIRATGEIQGGETQQCRFINFLGD
jgi:hypothetical protein